MQKKQYKRALILLADGARADVFRELIESGDMPNVSRYILEKGTSLDAVTTFPSTTGPAYLPFLTGCFPGTCNVPGIRWFDKAKYDAGYSFDRYRSYVGFESFCMASDMWPNIKTMFEIVPDSYSIFNPIARGTKGRRNFTRISRIWYWYYAHLTDHWGFVDEMSLKKLTQVLEREAKFVFAVFPGIDEYSHFTHPRHERVFAQYRNFDSHVGALCNFLKDRGELDSTAIFIVSDHGLSKTDSHFCVNTFLEKHDLPPFFYPLIYAKKGKLSASMVSGNGMANLYFKNHDGWSRHTVLEELNKISPSLIGDLVSEEAIDLVSVRNAEGGADVFSKKGRAKISLDGDKLHYKVLENDPFGYDKLPDDLSPSSILDLTFNAEYPDAPFQISHLLMSPRAGDVIISAKPGFDLRLKYENPEHFASHGSLHSTHMRVPLLTNLSIDSGPIRTVDVFPTVLDALGFEKPSYIDGKSLI